MIYTGAISPQLQGNVAEDIIKNGQITFRRSSSSVIAKAEEMWDVQETDGHCEVRTGQRPNP